MWNCRYGSKKTMCGTESQFTMNTTRLITPVGNSTFYMQMFAYRNKWFSLRKPMDITQDIIRYTVIYTSKMLSLSPVFYSIIYNINGNYNSQLILRDKLFRVQKTDAAIFVIPLFESHIHVSCYINSHLISELLVTFCFNASANISRIIHLYHPASPRRLVWATCGRAVKEATKRGCL